MGFSVTEAAKKAKIAARQLANFSGQQKEVVLMS